MKKIDKTTSDNNQPLTEELSSLVTSTSEYAINRVLLLVAEARLAIASVILMLSMAVAAVILVAVIWCLLCFALMNFVVAQGFLAMSSATLLLVMINLLALLVVIIFIRSLIGSLKFNNSLNTNQEVPRQETK